MKQCSTGRVCHLGPSQPERSQGPGLSIKGHDDFLFWDYVIGDNTETNGKSLF